MIDGLQLSTDFQILPVLDMLALMLFAITGAFTAAKRGYDWIGTMAIALVTGAGGGLMRDILLNIRPVLLMHEPYLWGILVALFLSTHFCRVLAKMQWAFFVADGLGLAMYSVIGTQKALNHGLGGTAAVLIGTLNAVGGSIIRDVLTQQELSLLKPGQWYAGIAIGASTVFCLISRAELLPPAVAGLLVIVVAFAVRIYVVRNDIQTKPFQPIGFEANRW